MSQRRDARRNDHCTRHGSFSGFTRHPKSKGVLVKHSSDQPCRCLTRRNRSVGVETDQQCSQHCLHQANHPAVAGRRFDGQFELMFSQSHQRFLLRVKLCSNAIDVVNRFHIVGRELNGSRPILSVWNTVTNASQIGRSTSGTPACAL